MKMNFAKTRFYLSFRFRLILLAGSALTLALFGRGVAVADLVAVGDFNGDHKPDYVLMNFITNQTAIWYMNNNVFVGCLFGPSRPAGGWEVQAVSDFNGDGHRDYVVFNFITLQTGIWYMNNNVFVSGKFGPTLPAGWFPVAVADFDGDGHPDLVLINFFGTQQTAIWYMN